MTTITSTPITGPIKGDIFVPSDKSMSHRALIFSALAQGESNVTGFLASADTLATLAALRQLGVSIDQLEEGQLRIQGAGLHGLKPSKKPLDLGNSGTGFRLLTGVLAAQQFSSVITGDASLQKRPMARILQPLTDMGAKFSAIDDRAPITIHANPHPMKAIHYTLKVASAQVKSALILASFYADETSHIIEPQWSRDHTERLLAGYGVSLSIEQGPPRQISVPAQPMLVASSVDIPGDPSSAAFLIIAAATTPGSELLVRNVGVNPSRIGFIDILRLMGADIHFINEKNIGLEPVADIKICYRPLHGVDIPKQHIVSAIDEFPVLFVAAARAKGITSLRGAEELRVKESDRLHIMAKGLRGMGIGVEEWQDGIQIMGGQLTGGTIDSVMDHRIAMAFLTAGMAASEPVVVQGCQHINTSFPGFMELANSVGYWLDER